MILKERTIKPVNGKFEKAGAAAEEKMAFYLRRYFQDRSDVWVLNDVRISRNGDFAQIDHLVVHTRGVVIIESKSVAGIIRVTADGQWIREYGEKRYGMQSPVVQAELQAMILCKNYQAYHRRGHMEEKVPRDIWPRLTAENVTKIVAVSDNGIYQQDQEKKHTNLIKADAVCKYILELIEGEAPQGHDDDTLRALARERAKYFQLASEICMMSERLDPLPVDYSIRDLITESDTGDGLATEWCYYLSYFYETKGMQKFIDKLGYTPVTEQMCMLASYAAHEKLVNVKSLEMRRRLEERRRQAAMKRSSFNVDDVHPHNRTS